MKLENKFAPSDNAQREPEDKWRGIARDSSFRPIKNPHFIGLYYFDTYQPN